MIRFFDASTVGAGCVLWVAALSGACDDSGGGPADGGARSDARTDTASIVDSATADAVNDLAIDLAQASDLASDNADTASPDAPAQDAPPPGPLRAKVDIVFVVDNSGSMSEEQANLARNFPAFMNTLTAGTEPEGPDLHIAVVSSDLGGGAGTFSPTCAVGGDQGLFCRGQIGAPTGFVPQDFCSRCGVDTSNGRFLRTRDRNFSALATDAFSCMARLGTGGCGFEHSLGALTAGLTNPANGDFLRDDAYLAFVIITDEDDCSAAPDSLLFTSANPLQDASLRCALEGHVCNGAAQRRDRQHRSVTG